MPDETTTPGPSWIAMCRQDFDAAEPLTLFDAAEITSADAPRKPDGYGTPDLFAEKNLPGPLELSPRAHARGGFPLWLT